MIGLEAGDGTRRRGRGARSFGGPAEIGRLFLTDHLLAFEITSIVLLVAAVGGVVLGRARERRGRREEGVMLGPDISWYLVVSAILFAIGARWACSSAAAR